MRGYKTVVAPPESADCGDRLGTFGGWWKSTPMAPGDSCRQAASTSRTSTGRSRTDGRDTQHRSLDRRGGVGRRCRRRFRGGRVATRGRVRRRCLRLAAHRGAFGEGGSVTALPFWLRPPADHSVGRARHPGSRRVGSVTADGRGSHAGPVYGCVADRTRDLGWLLVRRPNAARCGRFVERAPS